MLRVIKNPKTIILLETIHEPRRMKNQKTVKNDMGCSLYFEPRRGVLAIRGYDKGSFLLETLSFVY
jgi:hypothetical protein